MMEGTVIPSSRRPDGTWRKEIRVRAGYTPQDEVGAFETTASRMKSGAKSIPGYHQGTEGKSQAKKSDGPRLPPKPKKSTNISDPLKPRSNATCPETIAAQFQNIDLQETNEQSVSRAEDDQAKRLRKIKKKLREISELELKIQTGALEGSDEIWKKISQKVLLESEVAAIEAALTLT
jgi:partner of Y14 and mago